MGIKKSPINIDKLIKSDDFDIFLNKNEKNMIKI
jgi:hypothetical protein